MDEHDYYEERELLRTLVVARKTARSFFNYAALVARGIPVIMEEWYWASTFIFEITMIYVFVINDFIYIYIVNE